MSEPGGGGAPVERQAVAVVLDGPPTPAWQACALAELEASPRLTVVEVRLAGPASPARLSRLLAAIERRLLWLGADALAPRRIEPRGRADADALLVWLAEHAVPVDERGAVVQLRHGGLASARAAFERAVLREGACVESELRLERAGAAPLVVERTVSGVRRFSLVASRDQALWKMVALVRRGVERAAAAGAGNAARAGTAAGAVTAVAAQTAADAGAAAVGGDRPAGMAALARHALRAWPRVLATRLLYRRPWSILVRSRADRPTSGWSTSSNLVDLRPGHVYADPFLLEHEGRHHLFCEEVAAGGGHGVISHTELRGDGAVAAAPTPVLQRPYHLSYPCVFVHEGQPLMIPETSAVRRVELYRAIELPHRWERVAILLDDVDAVDATILHHDGRVWMFVGIAAEHASSLDELHLFWASAPEGPWSPHPCNPVVSDVRCARPGGAIQRWDGRLIRPCQDGSRRYGGALSFREIDVLSPTEYAEHEVDGLEPSDVDGARATHAYACDGAYEAIDLRRREPRWRALRRRGGAR